MLHPNQITDVLLQLRVEADEKIDRAGFLCRDAGGESIELGIAGLDLEISRKLSLQIVRVGKR